MNLSKNVKVTRALNSVATGTTNQNSSVIDSVIALQYGARVQPVTGDATAKAAKLLISPEEV